MQPAYFDLDGTLAESAGGIVASLEHALASCGVDAVTIDWRRRIGPPLQQMLDAALPDLSPGRRDDIVAAYREHYGVAGMYMTTLFPGVADVVERIAAGGSPIYVVTNKPLQPAEAIIRRLKLDGLVRRVIGGDPAGLGTKPDRAAALVAEEGLEGGVFIGDGLDDLLAAERIGARFLLAGWGYGIAPVLAERPDVQVLHQPVDLIAALGLSLP